MKSTLFLLLLVFSEPAHAGWVQDGIPVCGANDSQDNVVIVSDGQGGAIIAWQDGRDGTLNIYAQRVDGTGNTLWTHDGVALCTAAHDQREPQIASDGTGGAIVAWTDYRSGLIFGPTDVYAQRVDASGNVLWAADGVSLCNVAGNQGPRAIMSDGSGGAIVAWGDRRTTNLDIYVQRVNSNGAPQWTANGVAFCTAVGDQYFVSIDSDGAGGMIGTWTDGRIVSDESVYAQRVDGAGVALWAVNGVAVCNLPNSQRESNILGDGAGGAMVFWDDYRSGQGDLYAQRLNASGVSQWAANGIVLCSAPDFQGQPYSVSDGSSGAIVVWSDYRGGTSDLYAQRINSAGISQWAANGLALCDTLLVNRGFNSVTADGAGGVIATFQEGSGLGGDGDIYAQRLDSSGARVWEPRGLPISIAPGDQREPEVAFDGTGGGIIAWDDYRNGYGDIYAQRVYGSGAVPTSVDRVTVAPFRVRDNYPNPFTNVTTIEVELRTRSLVTIDVFDVAGRRVSETFRREMDKGWNRLVFDGHDEAGNPLPTGVYFYRVETNAGTVSRKMVIAR